MKDLSWTNCHAHEIDSTFIQGYMVEYTLPGEATAHYRRNHRRRGQTQQYQQPIRGAQCDPSSPGRQWICHENVTTDRLISGGKPAILMDETGIKNEPKSKAQGSEQ